MFLIDRYRHLRFRLADLNCLGYMALLNLLLPFLHREVPHWWRDFLIHLLFVAAGLEIVRLGERRQPNRVLRFLRIFYPLAFIAYGYMEVDHLQRMWYGSYWAADFLANMDKALFGVHPTVWIQKFYTPWLDELMSFCFWSYYLFLPLVALPLFFRGKYEEAMAAFGLVTFTYFVNFLLFYFFPALSPRMMPWLAAMHSAAEPTGYFFASLTRLVQGQEQGAIHGGCFPSSHVAGALAWALAAWRYNRTVSYFLFPLVAGVAVSTVYLRYHHAMDPLFGIILGFVCYPVAVAVLKRRREEPS